MNQVQYLDLSSQKAWHSEETYPTKEKEVGALLAEARNCILSVKAQKYEKTEMHLDKIKDLLTLRASFFPKRIQMEYY